MTVLNIQSPAFLGDVVIIWQVFIRILGYYGTKLAGSIVKNLCKTQVLAGTATFHLCSSDCYPPQPSLIREVARKKLLKHRCQSDILKPLKQVQDDLFNLLKSTYSPIHLFTYSLRKKAAFTLAEGATHVATSDNIRRAAFTLAEVLITLGIIGVVSAMTVPTLMQNHQKKVYVTQLHKIYNQLQQAALQYTNDRNALNITEAGINSDDAAANFVRTYFNVVQDCGTEQTPCFLPTGEYKKLSGAAITKWYPKRHFVLADGTSLGTFYSLSNGAIVEFWVDTNGTKGPNIVGRDVFVMYMYNNGGLDDLSASIPMSKEQRETSFTNYCMSDSGTNYHGCFGKILNDNWEMTY